MRATSCALALPFYGRRLRKSFCVFCFRSPGLGVDLGPGRSGKIADMPDTRLHDEIVPR